MECPICARQQLLDRLKQSPQNQEIRLKLMNLLSCKEDRITAGVPYHAQSETLCKIHRRWIHFEHFLNILNTGEIISLLFGKDTKRPH